MLVSFLSIGIAGIVVGCFFRAGALIAASAAVLTYAAIVTHGWNSTSAIATTIGLLATVQTGYICGLVINGLRKKNSGV
jgi:hypothetical protein